MKNASMNLYWMLKLFWKNYEKDFNLIYSINKYFCAERMFRHNKKNNFKVKIVKIQVSRNLQKIQERLARQALAKVLFLPQMHLKKKRLKLRLLLLQVTLLNKLNMRV